MRASALNCFTMIVCRMRTPGEDAVQLSAPKFRIAPSSQPPNLVDAHNINSPPRPKTRLENQAEDELHKASLAVGRLEHRSRRLGWIVEYLDRFSHRIPCHDRCRFLTTAIDCGPSPFPIAGVELTSGNLVAEADGHAIFGRDGLVAPVVGFRVLSPQRPRTP